MKRLFVLMLVVGVLVALPVTAGAANDPVEVDADGNLKVTGTNGNDGIFVFDNSGVITVAFNGDRYPVPDFTGDLTITSRSGDDFIELQSAFPGDVVINSGPDGDLVRVLSAVTVVGETRIVTGGGDDAVSFIEASLEDSVVVNLGSGNDRLFILNSQFGSSVLGNGQAGSDTFFSLGNTFLGDTDFKNFER